MITRMRMLDGLRGPVVAVMASAAGLLAAGVPDAFAQTQLVTVVLLQHTENTPDPPTLPLSALGRARAALLVHTLRDIEFTHVFASHTTRARETAEPVAADRKLPIVQLPSPGSTLGGETVTDNTSRQAAIGPLADAVLKLPAGSVALVAGNSDNLFGILNRLGVPAAAPGQSCRPGSMCVPCVTNACFPPGAPDRLWFVLLEPGQPRPLAMIETRYGAGWQPAR